MRGLFLLLLLVTSTSVHAYHEISRTIAGKDRDDRAAARSSSGRRDASSGSSSATLSTSSSGRPITRSDTNSDRSSTVVLSSLDVDDDDSDLVDVVIGYYNDEPNDTHRRVLTRSERGGKIKQQLKRINAVSTRIPESEISELEKDPNVRYVEYDHKVFLQQTEGETVSYGIPMINADSNSIPPPQSTNQGCFPICIIDAGFYTGHEDLPYSVGQGNLKGQAFDLQSPEQDWNNPVEIHGTHVAGIIAAQGGNNRGMVGVLPSNNNICLIIARPFGDPGEPTLQSSVDAGVEYCMDNGAKIINMSLGTHETRTSSQELMQSVVDAGTLVVAAAGNFGNSEPFYPAFYESSLSVAAVGEDLVRAGFSNRNAQVDVCAPGRFILSSIPGQNSLNIQSQSGGPTYTGYHMEDSVDLASLSLSGNLVDCGLGASTCSGVSGNICLLQRGDVTFATKAASCEAGGGIAAIIANIPDEEPGQFGTVNDEPGIPVIGVSFDDGMSLRSVSAVTIDINFGSGYREQSGTSMATPFVTGVAAKIWSARPQCTSDQIREAIESTAQDLGASGRDNEYGHGLVQADAAYAYLLTLPEPCGGEDLLETNPTDPPTESPTTASPTTASPTTASPTTASPTTAAPTTASPTTAAPTTASPTTASPTTASPTTAAPTTASPTTAAPTTASPTMAAPTTANPTTASPTTASPTDPPTRPPVQQAEEAPTDEPTNSPGEGGGNNENGGENNAGGFGMNGNIQRNEPPQDLGPAPVIIRDVSGIIMVLHGVGTLSEADIDAFEAKAKAHTEDVFVDDETIKNLKVTIYVTNREQLMAGDGGNPQRMRRLQESVTIEYTETVEYELVDASQPSSTTTLEDILVEPFSTPRAEAEFVESLREEGDGFAVLFDVREVVVPEDIDSNGDDSSNKTGLIIGMIVVGIVCLAVLVCLVYVLRRLLFKGAASDDSTSEQHSILRP